MSGQEWIALGIVAAAGAWLVRRWRRPARGEGESGCARCGAAATSRATPADDGSRVKPAESLRRP